jgi:hypothetical protein
MTDAPASTINASFTPPIERAMARFLLRARDVSQPFQRLSCVVITALALASFDCSRHDKRLEQHRENFESLGSTTAVVGEAWLSGNVSGTYTRTALEQTFYLVEQERTALAASPQSLLDPRGAQLSQAAERLSRLLAMIIHDVGAADAAAVRQHLAEIPIMPSEQR